MLKLFFSCPLECLILFPPQPSAPLPTRQVGEKCYNLLESSNSMFRDAMMMMPVVLGKKQRGQHPVK